MAKRTEKQCFFQGDMSENIAKKKKWNSASHWGLHHHTPGYTDDSASGHHAELSGQLFVLRVSKNAKEHLPRLSAPLTLRGRPAVLLNIKPGSPQCRSVRPNWVLISKYQQDKRFTGGTDVNTRFSIHTSSRTANYRCAIHAKPATLPYFHEARCKQIARIISDLPACVWIPFLFFVCVLCMQSDSTSIPGRL